jgi:hypothetical protein
VKTLPTETRFGAALKQRLLPAFLAAKKHHWCDSKSYSMPGCSIMTIEAVVRATTYTFFARCQRTWKMRAEPFSLTGTRRMSAIWSRSDTDNDKLFKGLKTGPVLADHIRCNGISTKEIQFPRPAVQLLCRQMGTCQEFAFPAQEPLGDQTELSIKGEDVSQVC